MSDTKMFDLTVIKLPMTENEAVTQNRASNGGGSNNTAVKVTTEGDETVFNVIIDDKIAERILETEGDNAVVTISGKNDTDEII